MGYSEDAAGKGYRKRAGREVTWPPLWERPDALLFVRTVPPREGYQRRLDQAESHHFDRIVPAIEKGNPLVASMPIALPCEAISGGEAVF